MNREEGERAKGVEELKRVKGRTSLVALAGDSNAWHIESFDDFVDRVLPEIVSELGPTASFRGANGDEFAVSLGDVLVGKPCESGKDLHPCHCAMRGSFYSCPVTCTVTVSCVPNDRAEEMPMCGKEKILQEVSARLELCEIPCMLFSSRCHLSSLPHGVDNGRRGLFMSGSTYLELNCFPRIEGVNRMSRVRNRKRKQVRTQTETGEESEIEKNGAKFMTWTVQSRADATQTLDCMELEMWSDRDGTARMTIKFPFTSPVSPMAIFSLLGVRSPDRAIEAVMEWDRLDLKDREGEPVAKRSKSDSMAALVRELLENGECRCGDPPRNTFASAFHLGLCGSNREPTERLDKFANHRVLPHVKKTYLTSESLNEAKIRHLSMYVHRACREWLDAKEEEIGKYFARVSTPSTQLAIIFRSVLRDRLRRFIAPLRRATERHGLEDGSNLFSGWNRCAMTNAIKSRFFDLTTVGGCFRRPGLVDERAYLLKSGYAARHSLMPFVSPHICESGSDTVLIDGEILGRCCDGASLARDLRAHRAEGRIPRGVEICYLRDHGALEIDTSEGIIFIPLFHLSQHARSSGLCESIDSVLETGDSVEAMRLLDDLVEGGVVAFMTAREIANPDDPSRVATYFFNV